MRVFPLGPASPIGISRESMRSFVGAAIILIASSAHARPIDEMVPTGLPKGEVTSAAVSSNVIYMNRCTGGCIVHYTPGSDNSTTDSSSIGGGGLTAFKNGDAVGGQVMTCLK